MASATVRGAEAVGESVDTAYQGVKNGFEDPENEAYGPYPRDYASTIRKHMRRFEGVKETASFQFAQAREGLSEQGPAAGRRDRLAGLGGGPRDRNEDRHFGQPDVDDYAVRMKDGDVVEVIEKSYAGAFRRISDQPASVPAAPQR